MSNSSRPSSWLLPSRRSGPQTVALVHAETIRVRVGRWWGQGEGGGGACGPRVWGNKENGGQGDGHTPSSVFRHLPPW